MEEEMKILIDKNIEYYTNLIIKLSGEIFQMKRKGICGDDVNYINTKWNNKIKSIREKEKGIKRINKILYRLNIYLIKDDEYRNHQNICLKYF